MAIGDIKENYTTEEWNNREKYYIEEIGKIEIPDNITTTDIKQIEAKIDKLFTEGRIELAYCKRKYTGLDKMKKLTEKELYLYIKQVSSIIGIKTIDEINGAVLAAMRFMSAQEILQGVGWTKNKQTIIEALSGSEVTNTVKTPFFTTLRVSEERLIFMESLIDILKDKRDSLIPNLGALKLEASLDYNKT